MPIDTGLPTDYVVPTTSHKFNTRSSGDGIVNIPSVIALISTKAASGTAVVGTVYNASSAAVVDALGGASSEGAMMARKAFEVAQFLEGGPQIRITFINEPAAGVARIQTITVTGTATSDGAIQTLIAGRSVSAGVRSGDLQDTIAANIHAAIREVQEGLPVLATVATNVVTLTHPTKGVNGQDVAVSATSTASGVTVAVAQTAAGTGAADIQPALDALAPLRYDGIVIANHASADITALSADRVVRWGTTSKKWGYYYLAETGTIGTATPLATSANHQAFIIATMEGCPSLPGEVAVANAMLVNSRPSPNAGFDGAILPLYPPNEGQLYTDGEQNTAIKAGLTPMVGVIDASGTLVANRVAVVQMVTAKTTSAGFPDAKNRDIGVSRVGIWIALQLDARYRITLGPEALPDGVPVDDAPDLVKDLAASILRLAARKRYIRPSKVEANVAALVAVPNEDVIGRVDAKIQYNPNTPNHQVAWVHEITVGP